MNKYEIIHVIASIMLVIAFSSLVLRVHLTKKTDGFTYTWIFLIGVAQLLIVIFGIVNNKKIVYIPALIILLGIIYIFYSKILYEETEKIERYLKDNNIL